MGEEQLYTVMVRDITARKQVEQQLRDSEADVPVVGQDGVTNAPLCAPGFPDCVDMIVVGGDGYVDGAEPVTDPR